MEPLTLATAFATIVGLLCNFKQERRAQQDLSSRDFLEWLAEHRHQELKQLIEGTSGLVSHLDAMLRQNADVLLARLKSLDDVLAGLATRIEGLEGLTRFLKPNAGLSEQAISILRQFARSGSSEFDVLRSSSGRFLCLISGGKIQYTEPCFLDDDLNALVEMGLLRLRYGSNGIPFYGITRDAVRFVEAIGEG
ncbi:MAG: hypothetical protein FJ291_09140 [Planctomycetes bacterium]|nr:hypothetical protein [Planctomycetota bacterium]